MYRHNCARGTALLQCGLYAVACVAGCNTNVADLLHPRAMITPECGEPSQRVAGDVVLLDWGGGVTALYPDQALAGLDLSLFATSDGGTLADNAEQFREDVRAHIARIFCDMSGPAVQLKHAAESDVRSVTRIYFTQDVSPVGAFRIGEGEYDPCNRQRDNVAVVFGEELRLLGGAGSYEEWVLIFANVAAHEIGHMLGFGHVERDEMDTTERSLFVELMLDYHTMDEMRREQRFVVDQTNCPRNGTLARAVHEYRAVSCGINTESSPER